MMKTKCLLYCTKALPNLYKLDENEFYTDRDTHYNGLALNGKIVCECEVETEEIEDRVSYFDSWFNEGHHTKTMSNKELEKRSCLSYQDLIKYLGEGEPNEVVGYALHLSNVKEKVMELSDVYSIKDIGGGLLVTEPLKKAPQNMMRVSINKWDYGFANEDDIRILISIRPEWLCKILNGKKDIEVRKKVLKGMCE